MLQPAPNEPRQEPEQGGERIHAPFAVRAAVIDPAWSAGRKLTEARQQLGLSISEVAERIRVRREFLEALEDMNVKPLPGRAYALAFLRSYARALGLDDKAIVDQFQEECALTREDAQKPLRNPKSRPHPERPWLLAAALVVLAAGLVGWRAFWHEESASAPAARGASVAPSLPREIVAEPATAPASRRVIEIRALQQAWLEARGPDGTVFLSQTLQPGDVYRPDPSPGWTLHARDGGSFEIFVNGQSAGLLGIAGSPVLGRSIDQIQPVTQAANAAPRT
jgi:transcriptional regulator with XRE-family HTH domain